MQKRERGHPTVSCWHIYASSRSAERYIDTWLRSLRRRAAHSMRPCTCHTRSIVYSTQRPQELTTLPFLPLAVRAALVLARPAHDTDHVTLFPPDIISARTDSNLPMTVVVVRAEKPTHALFIQSIQFEPLGGRGSSKPRPRQFPDGVECMDEDSIWGGDDLRSVNGVISGCGHGNPTYRVGHGF